MNPFRRKTETSPLAGLRAAVKVSDVVSVRAILAAHPELLNVQDGEGATPLHWAAQWQDLSVVAVLMDLGADPTIRDKNGHTPTDFAYWYGEFRMGAYTDVCHKIVQRLSKPIRNT